MATELIDTTVELPPDEPKQQGDLQLTPLPAEPVKKRPTQVLEPEVGLEKLKKQLDDEQRAAREASARAAAAEADAAAARASEVAARTEAQASNLHSVTATIAALNQATDSMEAQIAEASAAGDHARIAKLNREIAKNEAKVLQLEQGKATLEAAPKPSLRPTTPVAAADPVEALAAKLSARSAAWVRAHPEYASGRKYDEMVAADQLARARGIAPDTDAYFAHVEKTLDLADTTPAVEIDTEPQEATGGRTSAPVAAPVSRAGTGNGSTKPRTMKLTPQMREMAQMMKMTDQEYAKYRQQLIDEGQIH